MVRAQIFRFSVEESQLFVVVFWEVIVAEFKVATMRSSSADVIALAETLFAPNASNPAETSKEALKVFLLVSVVEFPIVLPTTSSSEVARPAGRLAMCFQSMESILTTISGCWPSPSLSPSPGRSASCRRLGVRE